MGFTLEVLFFFGKSFSISSTTARTGKPWSFEVLLSLSSWDEKQVEALIDQFDKNKDR
jgi:hypothetical protein